MRVVLIRHGEAETHAADGLDDDARALTPRARAELPGHVSALTGWLEPPVVMLMSPAVRASQTATIVAAALAHDGAMVCHPALVPGRPAPPLLRLIESISTGTLILVGHQPTMGQVAAHLLGVSGYPHPIHPGSVVVLERHSPDWTLVAHASPGMPPFVPS